MGMARERLAHLATSHWEVLSYGDVPGEDRGPGQCLVTYFTATKFTIAGINVYSRTEDGNPGTVVRGILQSLGAIEHEVVKKLAGEICEVLRN